MVTDPFQIKDLPEVYPIVEPFIERLYRSFGGYSPQETYELLEMRAATLHLVGDEGFFIAQWMPGVCHVLAAHSFNGRASDLSEIISSTVSYAKKYHCSKITFTSPREGWKKVAIRNGFHVETITYAKDI
ncbi:MULTISPECIES: hypothetical protein [unclassified Pseudoalteromonas]|uniref:hypothetical protein n=1 Tax=unclassified Pseudoalteromonas TaxID=194690 RepID=UPI00202B246E|nr:hypothetical protein [Pseudoalteromonas sp. SCSIO 43088]URQ88262.1 hypothetical protein J8Z28_20465 [Pseudoalteromonas sp. SCSIO 43088]